MFGEAVWPKPLHVLQGLEMMELGVPAQAAAKAVGTNAHVLEGLENAEDPVREVLGLGLREVDTAHRQRSSQMLGQLLVGRCAEAAFEDIYRTEVHSEEFQIKDIREGRTDTDYRLYNGRGRPVYRINIKFHGSPFRRAQDLVGLEPGDCFALATYKIHSALQKQREEALPYFFVVVGVPGLTGEAAGESIPSGLVEAVALVAQAPKGKGKRELEDRAVEHLVRTGHAIYRKTLERIKGADWYVLSAKRADKLLRELLFDRVFALRVRGFARAFKGAELDMHFSLSQDLIPLRRFLSTLREEGPQKITTLLERGDY